MFYEQFARDRDEDIRRGYNIRKELGLLSA
jgi:hypothetical protein